MKNRRGFFSSRLHPVYLSRYRILCTLLSENWQPIMGYRSLLEQDKIYAQGRTLPGPIVTQAQGGMSAHNWGLATDWGWFEGEKFIQLETMDPRWQEYMKACTSVGLKLISWDKPHNEYSLKKCTLRLLFEAYQDFGLTGVEKLLDEELI